MRELVIIPTFDRPEMLWHCLEHLVSAGVDQVGVDAHIYMDQHRVCYRLPAGIMSDFRFVCQQFGGRNWMVTVRDEHSFLGNSYNILIAYRKAADDGYDFVYMVEDDVMVQPGFFEWHRMVRDEHPGLFCSIATPNTRSGKQKTFEDFASLGVCFPRSSLVTISRRIRSAYFHNMQAFCEREFKTGTEHCEQDGLILRIMKEAGGFSVYADPALAHHIGWYGYNRGSAQRPRGNIKQRYDAVAEKLGVHIA